MTTDALIPNDPFDTTLVPNGILNADLDALASEFGTPLFVYDEDELRRRCREYVEHFGAGAVAYGGKAFLCLAMAELITEEGLHLDVATGGELHVALAAGVDPSRIVFHGNNKSDAEVEAGVDAGVGRFVVDSFDELARIERAVAGRDGPVPTVLVRVTPGVEAHTHEFIETGTQASKFGFTVSEGVALDAIDRAVASDGVHFGGIHCHIGSQIERLDAYGRAIEILADLARAVDGTHGRGGRGAEPRWRIVRAVSLRRSRGRGRRRTRRRCTTPSRAIGPRTAHPPRVTVEPGRSIAAPAGVTVYRVGTIKEIPGIGTYVAVDGGMSDNPRPVLYGAGYEAYLPARVGAARPLRCNVVGKHCEQGDVIVAGAQLPADVAVGDLLVTPTTGAYGYSMASNYNKVPRPAVVFLRDGEARPSSAASSPTTSSASMSVSTSDSRCRKGREGDAPGNARMGDVSLEAVRVGMLGCGNVGSAVVRLIDENAELLEARTGYPIEVTQIAVRDLAKPRDVKVPPQGFTDDPGDTAVASYIDVDRRGHGRGRTGAHA